MTDHMIGSGLFWLSGFLFGFYVGSVVTALGNK